MSNPSTIPEPPATPAPAAIGRLLVPLDGSTLAEAALPAAMELATRIPARVTLLHVMERGAPSTIHGHDHLNDTARAKAYLSDIAARFTGTAGVETHVHPNPEGDVAASIAAHAAEFGAGLIVLCAHGESDARGWLSGTIAQQVIRRSTPPVLLLRPEAGGTAAIFSPEGLLVALDLREHGHAALPPALTVARALDLPLRLIVAVPTLGSLAGREAPAAFFVPSATSAALDIEEEAAVSQLRSLCAALRGEGFAVRGEVVRGDPARMVAQSAQRTPGGILALATHGIAGFDAFWAESVGAKLIAKVTGPLLLVHP
ncbi:MAG: universal stress protein [Thermomicrobiales bacterium]